MALALDWNSFCCSFVMSLFRFKHFLLLHRFLYSCLQSQFDQLYFISSHTSDGNLWENMKLIGFRRSWLLLLLLLFFFLSSFLFCLTFVTFIQHSLKMHSLVQWRFSLPLLSGGCFYHYYLHHAFFLFFSFPLFYFSFFVLSDSRRKGIELKEN